MWACTLVLLPIWQDVVWGQNSFFHAPVNFQTLDCLDLHKVFYFQPNVNKTSRIHLLVFLLSHFKKKITITTFQLQHIKAVFLK